MKSEVNTPPRWWQVELVLPTMQSTRPFVMYLETNRLLSSESVDSDQTYELDLR